jgi:fatty acid desaturase
MEDSKKLFESLIDRAADYGKTSFELVKLKAVDKASDVVSSVMPNVFVLILVSSFILFLNLGLAIWLGEILGKVFYGFFTVAAFYFLTATVIHFFMHKSLKRIIRNYVIKQLLK